MTKRWTDHWRDSADPVAGEAERDRARHEHIMERAASIFAATGREGHTLDSLAARIGVPPQDMSRRFRNVDDLMGQTFAHYLRELVGAVLAAEAGAPARRCFLQRTHNPGGGFTTVHRVWVEQRRFLPDALRRPLEEYYQRMAPWLAWPVGDERAARRMLRELDEPCLTVVAMEARLGGPDGPVAAPTPASPTAPCRKAQGSAPSPAYENLLRAHRGTMHLPCR